MPREPNARQTCPSSRTPYQRDPHSITAANQYSLFSIISSENAPLHERPTLHPQPFVSQPCGYSTVQRSSRSMYRHLSEQIPLPPLIPNHNPLSTHTASRQHFNMAANFPNSRSFGSHLCQDVQAEANPGTTLLAPVPSARAPSLVSPRVNGIYVQRQAVSTIFGQLPLVPPSAPVHHPGASQHISPPPSPTPHRDYPIGRSSQYQNHRLLRRGTSYAVLPTTSGLPSRHFSTLTPAARGPLYRSLDNQPCLPHTPIIGHSRHDRVGEQGGMSSRETSTSQLLPFRLPHPNPSIFNGAHSFVVKDCVMTNTEVSNPDNFMEKLLKKTIPGAEFDSSDRNPPPRCHPGTRLAVIERCKAFILNCEGRKKLFWLVGFAGVGKSAVMQSIAESSLDGVLVGASVFFSVNGRYDGTKTITTLAYQLAVKCGPYRQFLQVEAMADPSLFQKSLPAQFTKLIIEPFIHRRILAHLSRLPIIIDGLDECSDPHTQWELLDLVSEFCITYPTSPLVWLVASRPEPHITSFFSLATVMPAYVKEEISVDTDEAREDVERFLREELKRVQESSESLSDLSQWPEEEDFLKLATAAGGLFAYASTVVKYIGDAAYGNPGSQLRDVLKSIDATLDHSQTRNPMGQLDSLYDRIMANVPDNVMQSTRKLLLLLALGTFRGSFIVQCNLLGMTRDDAYGAVHLLRSVLCVPLPNEAHVEPLESFHKSFLDYISDFSRSRFSSNVEGEYLALQIQYVFRIMEEVPDGVDYEEEDYSEILEIARGSGYCDDISLAWPAQEDCDADNDCISYMIYVEALEVICTRFQTEAFFRNIFCLRVLTRLLVDFANPSHGEVFGALFDESRRQEYVEHGILQQVHLKTLASFCSVHCVQVRLRRPAIMTAKLPDPWHLFCHEQADKWEGNGDLYWQVLLSKIYGGCCFCDQRFDSHLKSCLSNFPDFLVTSSSPILNPYPTSWVEFRFVDPNDGVSEWTYFCVFHRVNSRV